MRSMTDITLTQGQRIRYAREAAGLDQDQLAELLHVSRASLSAWERDKNKRGVPHNDLVAIALHTGYPLDFLAPRVATFTETVIGCEAGELATLGMEPLFSGYGLALAA